MLNMDECENRVEMMTRVAEVALKECLSAHRISYVVAAFSGGDDSIVSTHWTMNRFPDALVMNADTRIGLAPAREHITMIIERFKWNSVIVSPDVEGAPRGYQEPWIEGQTSYEEFVLNFGFPGPSQHARMYQRLKQRAFRKVKRELTNRPRGSRILVVSGIRGDESAIRAGYQRSFAEEPKEGFVWFNPFYDTTAIDFEAYRQWHGLPVNPVKRKCGISGECCCGSFAAPGERLAYEEVDPEFARALDVLEKRVMERFPWKWDQSPPNWWMDAKRGQQFLFPPDPTFMPACVGCHRRQSANT